MNRVAERSPAEQAGGRISTTFEPRRSAPNVNWTPPGAGHSAGSGVTKLERWFLRRVLQRLGDPAIQIVLWNGDAIATSSQPPAITLRINDRRTLWKLVTDPRFQFGEAYVDRRLDVDGEIFDLLVTVDRALMAMGDISAGTKGFKRWLHKPHRTTLSQSRENIHHHYDLGNEFYKLWLDEQLLYTCAYFAERTMSLEQAQIAKMDHVCRKVWLQPGESVVEAGCGWGALALHMARHYGVRVRAFNTSHEQILFARERCRREGLDARVEFVEDDWRNIGGPCDAFVSVGMLEHVGLSNYGLLGDVVRRCLKPSGRGLIHSIGRNRPHPTDPWIERRIFPGAYPPALSEMTAIFEPNGFAILDTENLRLHYAETLRHWLARFENQRERVMAMFDDRFVRMWRLYLSGSLAAFESGCLQLFQITFAPEGNRAIPRTRLYQFAQGEFADHQFFAAAAEQEPTCSVATS
jgi:cyclopropane-fatty-acyl-phospholipid synthase